MKLEIAKALYECDYDGKIESIQEDYSGRGMFGNETAGLVLEQYETVSSLIPIIVQLQKDDPELFEDFDSLDFDFRSDSMGLGTIVY